MDAAMTSTTRTACPQCGGPISDADLYCEACGAELQPSSGPSTPALDTDTEPTVELNPAAATPAGPCRSCGGTIGADSYCETCGTKATKPRDHFSEQPAPWVAAVCDRGIRHSRNEDAVAVAADAEPGSRAMMVVCDGVSSSLDSDVASLAAARAARDVLAAGHAQGIGTESSRVAAVIARLNAAADAASDAVLANTSPDSPNPASCTFVATVLEADLLIAGVVGDSRAYWFPDEAEAVALTVDDSWAAELIATGVPREQAETGPQAHAITRWLGKDAPDHTPRTTTLKVAGPGWLLVCSDGLWNYCSEAAPLAGLVRQTAAAANGEPLATASALVDWANAQGGQDNITVALARL
ncbi:serine/threonine protein phosphatase PrpC [Kribbella amoyensis]|uniref:Serine/threonine protein phosphatase PrpC n=1 Tax=Kribbella amoyensis TaxID=996641 RepID=A0A561BKE0_9ACTN|nr:protein phosphatase 2C domain-containing protein [Kribbella amoyensis]TWD79346.1 serine/threonine protein phosphatase PrpC [Kribbella amoyensis]